MMMYIGYKIVKIFILYLAIIGGKPVVGFKVEVGLLERFGPLREGCSKHKG